MKLKTSILLFCAFSLSAFAQNSLLDQQTIAKRNATEKELESVAIIERKLMIPMRDGNAWLPMSIGRRMSRRNTR